MRFVAKTIQARIERDSHLTRCPLCHWNYVGDPALAAPRLLLHQTLMHAHPVKGKP
jgi:hypothetical protein